MKTAPWLLLLLALAVPTVALAASPADLDAIFAREGADTVPVWVHFVDRGAEVSVLEARLADGEHRISDRALARRAKSRPDQVLDARDLPLHEAYLQLVGATGARPRQTSRWFNAASYMATREQVAAIAALPFVRSVDPVARFVRPREDGRQAESGPAPDKNGDRWTLDYGGSRTAAELINVPPVHDLGLSGAGVVVGVLDAGFVLSHDCFAGLDLLAQWDFVHGDGNVQWQEGDHEWQDQHGGRVLSMIMGLDEGGIVGTAHGASAILAMTEDTGDETIIEEDNWIAGLEWVESLGADIVTSSLGYYYWYQYDDLDGDTALTTVAADMAVERGLVVVTSAGNERQNEDWPHLTVPADGDSVIAVGAVDAAGNTASFSSPGPTRDGRIKPDLCALGVNTHVAAYFNDETYMASNGTSFAAPQIAGVAALMLERLPQLTPMQIREALRASGSQSRSPDNDQGWGIVDAEVALAYWGATIGHTPLADTEDETGPYLISATITDRLELDAGSLKLIWRVDGGPWQQETLVSQGGDSFGADIPGAVGGGLVEYYLEAGDVDGYVVQAPYGGPAAAWSFTVGTDSEAPAMHHARLTDQVVAHWAPILRARVTDNQGVGGVDLHFSVDGGAQQGPFALVFDGEHWNLPFPAAWPGEGAVLSYSLEARDTAQIPNLSLSGPHELRTLGSLGRVLVIDDLEGQAGVEKDTANLADDMALWLTEAGYEVQMVASGGVNGTLLAWSDVAFLTSGNNLYPVGDTVMRENLIAHVQAGGRVLVEGGESASASFFENQYLEFGQTVLGAESFAGDLIGPMAAPTALAEHPFLHRPHALPAILAQDMSPAPYDFASSDLVMPLPGMVVPYTSLNNSALGGVVLRDNNTGIEGGQVVYLSFDLGYMPEAQTRPLLENCLAYLVGTEAPGAATVSGAVTLSGSPDASGVLVSLDDDHTAITGPDGVFNLVGLHGATYTLTATKEGFGSETLSFELGADEHLAGLQLVLSPVAAVNLVDTPAMAIPDNNSTGMERTLVVTQTGTLQSITIDMDIQHPSIGQLEVELISPSGTSVLLHNHSGGIADDLMGNWPATLLVDGPGSLDDFLGEPAQGTWTMRVADTGWGALGTWNSWGLNLMVSGGLSAAEGEPPALTRIIGNHPNPFNPRTTLLFELKDAGPANLRVYDVQGRLVRDLGTENLPAGRHQRVWDGRDAHGRDQGSGLYFFRLRAGDVDQAFKMTLIR